MKTKLILFTGVLALAASMQAATTLTLNSGNANGVSVNNYSVSPYTGTITGDSALNNGAATGGIQLFCDDFKNSVTNSETWDVNINQVGGTGLTNSSTGGRFQLSTATATTDLYEEAVWLATQVQSYASTVGTTTGPAQTTAEDNEINAQEALWQLMDGGAVSGPSGDNTSETGPGVTAISTFLTDAAADYATASIIYSNWYVATDVGETGVASGGVQEFLINSSTNLTTTSDSNPPKTPEPASFLLIGSGLVAGAVFGRRRIKQNN